MGRPSILDAASREAIRALTHENLRGRNPSSVDAGGLKPNTWKRVERLESAWGQAKRGVRNPESSPDEALLGIVTEPRRRAQTPLKDQEVDAIRTARDSGERVISIAWRFGVSRMTVWEKTRTL